MAEGIEIRAPSLALETSQAEGGRRILTHEADAMPVGQRWDNHGTTTARLQRVPAGREWRARRRGGPVPGLDPEDLEEAEREQRRGVAEEDPAPARRAEPRGAEPAALLAVHAPLP